MTGIQSVTDPYDCLLSKPPSRNVFPEGEFGFSETYEIVPLEPEAPLRSRIGYATLALPEAPDHLNLLLGLNEDGQLTCNLVEDSSVDADTEESSDDDDLAQTPRSWRGIRPGQLLSRTGTGDDTDEEFDGADEDMDVDVGVVNANYGLPYIGTDEVILCEKAIRTREVWKSKQRCLTSS